MAQAWYTPKPISSIPIPKRDRVTETGQHDEDDEEGLMKSVDYICALIDKEVADGFPVERIVVGGFSPGCAISLLVGLLSRYTGKLGEFVGLSGYLPLIGKVGTVMEERTEKGNTRYFLAHGDRDQLVPIREFLEVQAKAGRVGSRAGGAAYV